MGIKSPFEGGQFRVTSGIGIRTIPEIGYNNVPHYGLDIVGVSSKNIVAVFPGRVGNVVQGEPSWGNYVRVDGEDGYFIYYCHMSRTIAVRGQAVDVGTVLGIEGSTGASTGPHLHIERRLGAKKARIPADPADPCNIAVFLGVANGPGQYTVTDEADERSDEWYAAAIAKRVGYADPGFAAWSLARINHTDRNTLLRKLWEALQR